MPPPGGSRNRCRTRPPPAPRPGWCRRPRSPEAAGAQLGGLLVGDRAEHLVVDSRHPDAPGCERRWCCRHHRLGQVEQRLQVEVDLERQPAWVRPGAQWWGRTRPRSSTAGRWAVGQYRRHDSSQNSGLAFSTEAQAGPDVALLHRNSPARRTGADRYATGPRPRVTHATAPSSRHRATVAPFDPGLGHRRRCRRPKGRAPAPLVQGRHAGQHRPDLAEPPVFGGLGLDDRPRWANCSSSATSATASNRCHAGVGPDSSATQWSRDCPAKAAVKSAGSRPGRRRPAGGRSSARSRAPGRGWRRTWPRWPPPPASGRRPVR